MKRWLYAAGALFLLAVTAKSCYDKSREQKKNERSVAKADSATKYADSVRIEIRARDDRVSQLLQAALVSERAADVWRDRALANEAIAEKLAGRSAVLRDSLAKARTASDSVSLYQQQVSSLEGQVGAWKSTAEAALAAEAQRQESVDKLLRGAIVADSSKKALEATTQKQADAIADLRKRVVAAEAPCRILFARCPSRTAIAIGAAVSGAIIDRVLLSRQK